MPLLPPDLRRMLSLLSPERGRYARGLTALFFVNLGEVLSPLFIALAIDLTGAHLNGQPVHLPLVLAMLGLPVSAFSITGTLLTFLGIQVVVNICRYPMLMEVAVPAHRTSQRMRNRIVDFLLRQGRPFFDKTPSGELMSRATADIQAVRMFFGPGILLLTDTVLLVALVLLAMFSLSWRLSLAALIPLPVIAWVTRRLSLIEFQRFGKVQDDLALLTEEAREVYSGIHIVQGFAREPFFRRRFGTHSRRQLLLNLRLARIRSLFDPSLDLLIGLSTVLVLLFGGIEMARGRATLGTFVAFLFLVGNLSGPMIGFGWAAALVQRGRASFQRIEELQAHPITITDAPGAVAPQGPGALEVRGLTFLYPGSPTPALSGIDISLPPGKRLGILGRVGSGKSTLLALLVRLYDPPSGTITLDGIDIRQIQLHGLRRALVLSPQDTFLFSDSIGRNIALGAAAGELPPAQVEYWARLAAIDGEINALTDGYGALLGERGINLSGGQRQRVALARLLSAEPQILLLDDGLSAVDTGTEDDIWSRLRPHLEERSLILVSQRVRAVSWTDEILVFDSGRIVERGTHTELLQHGGFYSRIAAVQAQSEAGFPPTRPTSL